MPEHFTHTTTEAKFWCNKCGKPTMHYVASGRRGGCQTCIAVRDEEKRLRDLIAAPAKQDRLF